MRPREHVPGSDHNAPGSTPDPADADAGFWFPDGQMETWTSLGAVTDRSVRVWLRDPAGGPQIARLRLNGAPAAEAELRPRPEHDHVAAVDLTLPEPAPGASFAVEVAGMVRRGRLAPADGQPAAFTFLFGSCHEPFVPGPADGPPRRVHPRAGIYSAMSRVLGERDARFLLLLGDQIYSDGVSWTGVREYVRRTPHPPDQAELRALYRALYRGFFHQAGFRSLLEGWPSYMIWDDHDIYDGRGSLLRREIGPRDGDLFEAADTVFREYQHLRNPDADLAASAPYHFRFWYGDTGFFVFDLRSERDYLAGTLLGPRQRADFHRFVEEADARDVGTLFVGATIPIVHISPAIADLTEWLPGSSGKGVRDRWTVGAYRPMRDEVLEALFDWQSARPYRQVIVLSGDVHVGAAFRLTRRGRPGRLQQWTCSPFSTSTSGVQTVANLVGTTLVNWGENRYHAERGALVLHHGNFGLVAVRPAPGGGHEVGLDIFAFDPRRQRLRRAAHLTTRPLR